MDSLTHIVLGAALGEVTLGKKLGYKAAIVGAIADTVPDFDVFPNFLIHDEITKLHVHRSYSHAMVPQIFMGLVFAWLTHLIFNKRIPYWQWYLLWMLGFTTHSLLDCCTTYGTQYLLPFTDHLVGFNNISVVDIFFTLPFLVFVVAAQFIKKENPLRIKLARAGLAYALLYIVLTIGNKAYIHHHFSEELKRQNIQATNLYTSPTLFNNFLWAGIALNNDSLWLGEYSIFQKHGEVQWVGFARNLALVKNWPDKRSTDALEWFSQGKYFVQQNGDTLNFFNTKWGRSDFRETVAQKALVFYFMLYHDANGWQATQRQPNLTWPQFKSAFGSLWRRVFGMD